MISVRCERCGGKLAKWDAIGLDWVMYCINCGSEYYTREEDIKEQWAVAKADNKESFIPRPRIMALSRRQSVGCRS